MVSGSNIWIISWTRALIKNISASVSSIFTLTAAYFSPKIRFEGEKKAIIGVRRLHPQPLTKQKQAETSNKRFHPDAAAAEVPEIATEWKTENYSFPCGPNVRG